LGATANEAYSPTASEWAPNYAGNYAGALMAQFLPAWAADPTLTPNDVITPEAIAAAHQAARQAADANRPAVGSEDYNRIIESVRSGFFQRGGAGFIDDSNLWHVEGNYDFSNLLNDVVSIQVGGNWRQYDLFTDGTIFNEDPEGTGTNERIQINEFGGYLQLSKRILQEKLKLTGSIRYDKNENFEGQFSPRVSAVYSVDDNRNHNIRASFQTGFRNPTTQGQFIYFPTTNIIIGGTEANAGRYGIYEGGAWSKASYDMFQGALLQGATMEQASALLETQNLNYVQPERLQSFELGYKGLFNKKFLFDISGYYNTYNDFIVEALVVAKEPVTHKGEALPPNQVFSAYTNVDEEIRSWGVAAGMTYRYNSKLEFTGNYSYADMDHPEFFILECPIFFSFQ
jgi:iron complex outermembrane receptor protein